MKKKLLKVFILFIVTSCFYGLLFSNTANAEDIEVVSQIGITQYPTKTTYASGESLDFTGMIVTSYNYDGTSNIITNYDIEGYDDNQIGAQTVIINYQNHYAAFSITVIPPKVTNNSVSRHSTTSLTLTWDALADINRYEIYCLDDTTGLYNLIASSEYNSITLDYSPGTIHSYQICAVWDAAGTVFRGELSDSYRAATDPDIVTGLAVLDTSTSSITFSWEAVSGATGYKIYRSPVSKTNYTYCGNTERRYYTDDYLYSGQSFKYKVCAYTLNDSYLGSFSSIVKTSTNPAKMYFKSKAGDEKIRFTWSKITGATSYDIYIGDDKTGFSLLSTNKGNSSCSYIVDGLTTGKSYSFYAIAKREYEGDIYESPALQSNRY